MDAPSRLSVVGADELVYQSWHLVQRQYLIVLVD